MIATATAVDGRFAGTRTIVRFNWPKYLVVGLLAVAAVVAGTAEWPASLVAPLAVAAGFGAFWSVTSLVATWWVYDRTGVYGRVGAGLGSVGTWAIIHAGFDESNASLVASFGHGPDAVVALHTTARRGLRHARREQQAPATAAPPAHLPIESASLDAVFLTLAVHEVRPLADQRSLFAELDRVLRPGGRLVITEHLRDLPNFAVYGPACWHFQSARTWRARAGEQGLTLVTDEPITPFVRRLVWTREAGPATTSTTIAGARAAFDATEPAAT